MSSSDLTIKLKKQLGKSLSKKGLEVLTEQLLEQEKVVENGKFFNSNPIILLAWYMRGNKVIDAFGSGIPELLGNLLNSKPNEVACAVLTSVPDLFSNIRGGLAERILERCTELPTPLMVTLLENVPQIANVEAVGVNAFEHWFKNRQDSEDEEAYLGLQNEGLEVLRYFAQSGNVQDILTVVHDFTGKDRIQALCAVSDIEKRSPKDLISFLGFVKEEGKDFADRFYTHDPDLSAVLKEMYPLQIVLKKGFNSYCILQSLENAGITAREITQWRQEARQRNEEFRLSEDKVAENYCIAVNSLDQWMFTEQKLIKFDQRVGKIVQRYAVISQRVNNALRRVGQLEATAKSQIIKSSVLKHTYDLASEMLPQSNITAELKTYAGVEVEQNYFKGVISRFREELENEQDAILIKRELFDKKLLTKNEDRIHIRDWNRDLFTAVARQFGNHHPFYYDKNGKRYVNIPREDLKWLANTEGVEFEQRAGHTYFTKPNWKVA